MNGDGVALELPQAFGLGVAKQHFAGAECGEVYENARQRAKNGDEEEGCEDDVGQDFKWGKRGLEDGADWAVEDVHAQKSPWGLAAMDYSEAEQGST
jgi:hypothetical protein